MRTRTAHWILIFAIALTGSACGGGPAEVTCSLLDQQGQVVSDAVEVEIGWSGPASVAQVLVDGAVVASQKVDGPDQAAILTWQAGNTPDGPVSLTARVSGAGQAAVSAPLDLTVDNTPPVAAFGADLERMALLDGQVQIPLGIQEANPSRVRVVDLTAAEVLLSAEDALPEAFDWDTTGSQDGLHELVLEVTDAAGHFSQAQVQPVVVANRGEEVAFEFLGPSELTIPVNYEQVEYHVQASVDGRAGITRVLSWITWDAAEGWQVSYDLGQGLCPHRGISYANLNSTEGEIIIDLDRSQLPADIVSRFPAADQDSATFPYNGDPLTFGAFFGHVNTLDPADHIEQSLAFDLHFVFFYEE